MGFAPRASNPVKSGKARTAYKTPVTAGLYHPLPSATTKPKEPIECGQYSDSRDRVGIVEATGGGPEGRSMEPHTAWPSVADPHVANHRTGWPRTPHPAFASFWAYGPIFVIKAIYFGKEFLRMAGIVQMLHCHKPPYDKYPYAHRTRTLATQPRNQKGRDAHPSLTVPGQRQLSVSVSVSMAHTHWLSTMYVRSLCCHTLGPVWPILTTHISITRSISSVYNCISVAS